MEKSTYETRIYKDEDGFIILCYKKDKNAYWECYLIYEKTQDSMYVGGYDEDENIKLEDVFENNMDYYKIDLLKQCVEKYFY